MSQEPMSSTPEISSDDKLWAALSYIFAPIVGIIALLIEEKKARPYIKFHAIQSIVAIIGYIVVSIILSTITLGIGGLCVPLLWLVFLYWAYQAYQGQQVKIPFISDFIRNQGWA